MIKKISELTVEDIAGICDHTFLLRPEGYLKKAENPIQQRRLDFTKFLKDTINMKYPPYAICIRPEDVSHAKEYLIINKRPDIITASVVGFPDGSWYSMDFKLAESGLAIGHGAQEIDFVLNCEKLKQSDFDYVERETDILTKLIKNHNVLTKMILETSELNEEQIIKACNIADKCGVDFVKSSSGFSSSGATAKALYLMRKHFSRGVKMSGGVSPDNYKRLLAAASGRKDGYIDFDPLKIRIGESSLLGKLSSY
jgi:deoxyribose-phosphate aldolase